MAETNNHSIFFNMAGFFPFGTQRLPLREDVETPRSVSAEDLNVVVEQPVETNSERWMSIEDEYYSISLPVSRTFRWVDVVTPTGLVSATIVESLNVVVDQPAITNNQSSASQGFMDLLTRRVHLRQGLVSATAETNNQRPVTITNDSFRYATSALQGFWRQMFGGDAVRQGLVSPTAALEDIVVEQPAETDNQRSLMSNAYGFLGPVMKPGSAFKLVMLGLFGFAEIKSQGETEFPFKTHPLITRVAINSVPTYGLFSFAEYVISTAGPGPDSAYASIARLGTKLCLCVLIYGVDKL